MSKAYLSAFTQALAELGWTDGRNVRMDVRWGGDGTNWMRGLAQELVGLQPDVIDADDPDRFCGRGRSCRWRHRTIFMSYFVPLPDLSSAGQAPDRIRCPARREPHDNRDGARGIGLRPGDARCDRERGSARSQMQKFSSVGKFHFVVLPK